jgi:exodeoxyribonuclease I
MHFFYLDKTACAGADLNSPEQTTIRYNILLFYEPFLRQAFYQTLQPIYLTNTNGNQRVDVLRLAKATAALVPNAVAVPISDKGKLTLRLDTLIPANGFVHENALDALADVEATIYMALLMRDRAPNVWNSLIPLVDKGSVIGALASGAPKSQVEYHMGWSVIACRCRLWIPSQEPNNSGCVRFSPRPR